MKLRVDCHIHVDGKEGVTKNIKDSMLSKKTKDGLNAIADYFFESDVYSNDTRGFVPCEKSNHREYINYDVFIRLCHNLLKKKFPLIKLTAYHQDFSICKIEGANNNDCVRFINEVIGFNAFHAYKRINAISFRHSYWTKSYNYVKDFWGYLGFEELKNFYHLVYHFED